MSAHQPPPGAVPSGMMSPDMQSTLAQMTASGGAKAGGAPGQQQPFPSLPPMGGAQTGQTKPARPVGTLQQEAAYLAKDVAQGVVSVLPDTLQELFGIKVTDSAEEKQKKQQLWQRYQGLTAEEQKIAQQKVAEMNKKKQQEAAEAEEKKRRLAATPADLPEPKGKVRGEGGPGMSGKQRTVMKLQNDRKRMSNAG